MKLFLAQGREPSAMESMRNLQALVRPALMAVYHITAEEADFYFRDLWFKEGKK